jgi:signal transduction histidine kinase
MEGELAAMGALGKAESEVLRRMSEGARDVTDSMRRIVWALGSGQDTLGDLMVYIRSSAAELMENAELELTTTVELITPTMVLSADQRRHLLLITKELLLNVVRHAQARCVELRMQQTSEAISITISDDGVGFDPISAPGTGTGRISVRDRARALGGTVTWSSFNGKGTHAHLRIPLTSKPD